MRQDGFKNSDLLVVVAVFISACSPMTPSVSKLSNTAAHPTEGAVSASASSSRMLGTQASLLPGTQQGQAEQVTQVVTAADFAKVPRTPQELVIQDVQVQDNLCQRGSASFTADVDGIHGYESSLIKGKAKIYFVVDVKDAAVIKDLRLNEIAARIEWAKSRSGLVFSDSNPRAGHWKLMIVQPSTSDIDQIMGADTYVNLKKYLKSIVVQFEGSLMTAVE